MLPGSWQLISTGGVKLVALPDSTWNIDGFTAKLHRTLSVTFSVDSIVSSEDVVEAFCNAGTDFEHIVSAQYRGSNHSCCVSFCNKLVKEHILEKGIIRFGDVSVFISDLDFKTVIVKIYEAPPENADTVVIGRLSHYGRILSFRPNYGAATWVLNSIRRAHMQLMAANPLSVRIAGELIFVSYPNQPDLPEVWRRRPYGTRVQKAMLF